MEGIDTSLPLINTTIALHELGTTLSDALITILLRKKRNPYLEALPDFIYSMPAQILILGVTLTLLTSLLIHLLFTIRYHLPLSKLNYILQLSAVLLTLGNTCGNLVILIKSILERAQRAPYMFLYIEVPIPPTHWSKPTLSLWLMFQGIVTLSVHVTHIQFLTLLFPSGLEVRLIMALLGPLAVASSFLSFVDLSELPAVIDLGEAIRDTCDSSLTLLYTLAIFGWSLTLNRQRAWRSEGGTVAFGIVALILGASGTALNFLEIREERLLWLAGVVDCILLWQSWVSLWWWVGSGMWDGEAADVHKRIKKAERLEQRRLLKKLQATQGEAAVAGHANGNASEVGNGVGSSLRGISSSVRRRIVGNSSRLTPINTSQLPEEIELQNLSSSSPHSPPSSPAGSTIASTPIPHQLHPLPAFFLAPLISLFTPFFNRLKLAHDKSITLKALESTAEEEGRLARTPNSGNQILRVPKAVAKSWGIKSLIQRGTRELEESRVQAGVGGDRGMRDGGGNVLNGEVRLEGRRAGFEIDGAVRLDEDEEEEEEEEEEREREMERGRQRREEDQWEDENVVENRRERERLQDQEEVDNSWGIRNLIRRWRLKDVATF